MSDFLRPHELQHTWPPCPSATPGVHPNPCPSSWWCHPTISSSVVPFSSCPESLPATESFPMSQLFAIQPSYPLSSPSPPTLNLSQHQGLFKWVSSLHQVAKVLKFQLQYQSFQWTPRTELLYGRSPYSARDSQESSPTPQFKSFSSSALSFLHSPTLTSIHDY